MQMNLPNKLTILRVILIVPFVLFLLLPREDSMGRYLSVLVFVIASLTDLADGKIARKYNLITNFGKFMDPLADKLLVGAAMICLVETGELPAWIVVVIISREFIISGFRLVASDNGVVIAAGYWGKIKTTVQMIMIIMLILNFENSIYQVACTIVIYLSLALTIISLLDYLWKNKEVLKEQEEINLEEVVAKLLQDGNLTISTAESCTGGMVSAKLINVSGISSNFMESYVTYSNEAKEKLLGVSKETLKIYGAVSMETASEMAKGCKKAAGTDLAISITGIAGPDGGTAEKPVGLVYMGCAYGEHVYVERHVFKGNRNQVRESATNQSLLLLHKVLTQEVNHENHSR